MNNSLIWIKKILINIFSQNETVGLKSLEKANFEQDIKSNDFEKSFRFIDV